MEYTPKPMAESAQPISAPAEMPQVYPVPPMPLPMPMPIYDCMHAPVSPAYSAMPPVCPQKAYGRYSDTGIILVLFILLVIISRGRFR